MSYEKEIYYSIDIECDGPCPGLNSMISIGIAAFTSDGKMIDTFSRNVAQLPGAKPDPKTMNEFWAENPLAWEATQKDKQLPQDMVQDMLNWVDDVRYNVQNLTDEKSLRKSVAVAYPAGFDWSFVYYYIMRYSGYSPFSWSCLDVKTLAMAVINKRGYRYTVKKKMPKHWFDFDEKHTHVAIDDAIEQGKTFCLILADLMKQRTDT